MGNLSSPKSAVQELASQATSERSDVLGELVWWSLGGPYKSRLDILTYLASLDKGALPKFPKLQKRTAVWRGLKSLESDRIFVRRLKETDERIFFTVVEEAVDGEGDETGAQYEIENAVVFNKSTQKVKLKTDWMSKETAHRIKQAIKSVAASDLASFIIKTMKHLNAVRIRENGGVYFVPIQLQKHLDTLERFIGFVSENGRCTLYRLPLAVHKTASKTVAQVARDEILEALKATKLDLVKAIQDKALTTRKANGVIRRLCALKLKTCLMVKAVSMEGSGFVSMIDSIAGKLEAWKEKKDQKTS